MTPGHHHYTCDSRPFSNPDDVQVAPLTFRVGRRTTVDCRQDLIGGSFGFSRIPLRHVQHQILAWEHLERIALVSSFIIHEHFHKILHGLSQSRIKKLRLPFVAAPGPVLGPGSGLGYDLGYGSGSGSGPETLLLDSILLRLHFPYLQDLDLLSIDILASSHIHRHVLF
ncbi:hypothetical protein B0O80DRAFT_496397 [Mortierella sp. GBAus27b]|nr:hypothetical protein B0O80DRAFT_496397 [Mortierella sp. GBAus27b]